MDPFRKRDLPNPEAMLAQILSDVDAERRAEELEQSRHQNHRWLRVVAAAAATVVVGGVGWSLTLPGVQQATPGAQPVPTAPSPTPPPTPTPQPTVVPQPLPSMRTTTAPQRRTPAATPTPAATSTPTSTPTPDPSPTAASSQTPTAVSPAGEPAIDPPRVYVTDARRAGVTQPGFDFAVVNAVACPGSRGARIWGPSVTGATALSGEGSLSPDGTLVDRHTCIQLRLEVEVPTDEPTEVTVQVQMEYEPGTPEEVNNGTHEGSATIE